MTADSVSQVLLTVAPPLDTFTTVGCWLTLGPGRKMSPGVKPDVLSERTVVKVVPSDGDTPGRLA